jgi:hypothetical protein
MMAKFLSRLTVTEIDDKVFALHEPFSYSSDLLATQLDVPVGFYTDFASVPRLGVIYAMLGDCAHEPAVIHDWLYYTGLTDRETSDDILLEAMGVKGISRWKRYPIWWGVRLGGWVAWRDHRKQGHSINDSAKITQRFMDDQSTCKV